MDAMKQLLREYADMKANQFMKDKFMFGFHTQEDSAAELIDKAIAYLNNCKKQIAEDDDYKEGKEANKKFSIDIEIFEVGEK